MINKRKEYFYEVDLTWKSERTGKISSMGLPDIEVVPPPEFLRGKKNQWTPEHMLAGAIASCFMTTFMGIAENGGLQIIDYKSHCFIKLEIVNDHLEATEILLRPIIKLISDQLLSKAINLIEKAEGVCPIKNALKLSVEIHPQFEFLNRGEKAII